MLPTVSLDCLDLCSLEALLAWRRGALRMDAERRGVYVQLVEPCSPHLPEEGLLHRLDTDTQGWVTVATTSEAYEAYVTARDNGRVAAFYNATIDVSKLHDSLWYAAASLTAHGRPWVSIGGDHSPDPEHDAARLVAAIPQGEHLIVAVRSRLVNVGPRTRALPIGLQPPREGSVEKLSVFRVQQDDLWAALDAWPGTSKPLHIEGQLRRGARHQLRCHLAEMGTPILHDSLYGKETTSEEGSGREPATHAKGSVEKKATPSSKKRQFTASSASANDDVPTLAPTKAGDLALTCVGYEAVLSSTDGSGKHKLLLPDTPGSWHWDLPDELRTTMQHVTSASPVYVSTTNPAVFAKKRKRAKGAK